jgi:hypothetical protein
MANPQEPQLASLIISIIILIIVIILIIIVCCGYANNTNQPRIKNPQAAIAAAMYKNQKNNFETEDNGHPYIECGSAAKHGTYLCCGSHNGTPCTWTTYTSIHKGTCNNGICHIKTNSQIREPE